MAPHPGDAEPRLRLDEPPGSPTVCVSTGAARVVSARLDARDDSAARRSTGVGGPVGGGRQRVHGEVEDGTTATGSVRIEVRLVGEGRTQRAEELHHVLDIERG